MTDSTSPRRPEAANRTAEGVMQVWERRTQLVKQELAAASAAADAKTARLRALRLEKEAQEAAAARIVAEKKPAALVKKRPRRRA